MTSPVYCLVMVAGWAGGLPAPACPCCSRPLSSFGGDESPRIVTTANREIARPSWDTTLSEIGCCRIGAAPGSLPPSLSSIPGGFTCANADRAALYCHRKTRAAEHFDCNRRCQQVGSWQRRQTRQGERSISQLGGRRAPSRPSPTSWNGREKGVPDHELTAETEADRHEGPTSPLPLPLAPLSLSRLRRPPWGERMVIRRAAICG